jgi:hypothetical protein
MRSILFAAVLSAFYVFNAAAGLNNKARIVDAFQYLVPNLWHQLLPNYGSIKSDIDGHKENLFYPWATDKNDLSNQEYASLESAEAFIKKNKLAECHNKYIKKIIQFEENYSMEFKLQNKKRYWDIYKEDNKEEWEKLVKNYEKECKNKGWDINRKQFWEEFKDKHIDVHPRFVVGHIFNWMHIKPEDIGETSESIKEALGL